MDAKQKGALGDVSNSGNPSLTRTSKNKPSLAQEVKNNPSVLKALKNNPAMVHALKNNPSLVQALKKKLALSREAKEKEKEKAEFLARRKQIQSTLSKTRGHMEALKQLNKELRALFTGAVLVGKPSLTPTSENKTSEEIMLLNASNQKAIGEILACRQDVIRDMKRALTEDAEPSGLARILADRHHRPPMDYKLPCPCEFREIMGEEYYSDCENEELNLLIGGPGLLVRNATGFEQLMELLQYIVRL